MKINNINILLYLGLDEKIEYMNKLGVQNVVLTSVFKSNDGSDVDFVKNNVTTVNGTSVQDFIKKLKNKGTLMKI